MEVILHGCNKELSKNNLYPDMAVMVFEGKHIGNEATFNT